MGGIGTTYAPTYKSRVTTCDDSKTNGENRHCLRHRIPTHVSSPYLVRSIRLSRDYFGASSQVGGVSGYASTSSRPKAAHA